MKRYECTCREWEERPCDNPNEEPPVECQDCCFGREVERE